MSVKDKLDYLQDTKQAIKTAIQGKGQAVSDADTFRSYADKINAITTGGGGTDETTKELIEGTLTEFNDTAGSISIVRGKAFYQYSSLTSVSFPNCSYVYASGFCSCHNLSNIYLPKLSGCGVYAFAYVGQAVNTGFTIDLPNLINNAQYMSGQFWYCGAETINLPKLSYINGSGMFQGCSKLKNISMPLLSEFRGQGDHYSAFANCIALEQVEFPSLLATCSSMFQGCTSLTSVRLPECSRLYRYTFSGCIKLTDLYAPKITFLDAGVFSSCYNLSNIDVSNCSYVGAGAFTGCSKITSVNLPLISSIYGNTFYNCIQLQSVYAPQAQTIGGYAFYKCSSLQFMSLSKCTAISSSAFYSCHSLSAIYLQKKATLATNAFTLTPMSLSSYLGYFGSIYVRSVALSWYQSATNWVAYSSRITTFTPAEATLQENGADVSSGTSLTITLENCEVGDNLIAGVITRSASSTPTGWTLLATAPTLLGTDNVVQYLNIYTKVATSTTESITVTQSTAGRIYANIVNIKDKTASVINSLTNVYDTSTQPSITLTKPTNNEILVFVETISALVAGAFDVDGDYNYDYPYGERGRLTMIHSSQPIDSQIIITHRSTGDIQWATIGIELT